MIGRDGRCRALVLGCKPFGEKHAAVTLLTDQHGLSHYIAHGAYSRRGRLRALTNRFCDGLLYSRRGNQVVDDFEAEHFYLALRANMRRYYTACLWAELMLASFVAGEEAAQSYRLLAAALEYLDQCPEEYIAPVSARFLWRYVDLNGMRPDLESCMSCGRTLARSEPRFYPDRSSGICCRQCASEDMHPLSADSLAQIAQQGDRRMSGKPEPLNQQLGLLYALVQHIIERPLKTLRIAAGTLQLTAAGAEVA